MRSPGRTRLLLERVLRSASLLALLALAVRLWSGTAASGASRSTTDGLDSALVRWSMDPPGDAVVDADTLPVRAQRDWLVALRRTGTNLRWTSRDSSGGALVVQAAPQPGAAARVAAITMPGRSVYLADALGFVDSASASERGVVSWTASPIGIATANVGYAIASAAPRDSLSAKPVLVVGQAGWESRFVVTALEESGWSVAARMQVAPGAVVRQQTPAKIDTASLSTLVVLDSTSTLDGGEVATFVRQGGGLVASGPGTRHAAIRALLPQVRDGTPGEIGGLLGPTPRTGLSTRTLVADAASVPLERRGKDPVAVGRRIGSGRVLAVGYDETWRLRMVPTADSAPDVHRNWWSAMVGGVALVRPVAREVGMVDEAPYASTVAALGRPVSSTGDTPPKHWPWEMILALIAGLALLGEWTSRRLRGLA